jgi:DNA polymerase III delta subunit
MTLTVLVGDDAICARQAQILRSKHNGITIDRIDAAIEPVAEVLNMLLSNSLFATSRVVQIDNIDKIHARQLELVAAAIFDSGHDVIATCRALNAGQRKAITKTDTIDSESGSNTLPEIIEFPALDGRRGIWSIDMLARSAGITLTRQVKQRLLERVAHDPARLLSVLELCRIGSVTNPTVKQIEVLCGTAAAPGVPWNLGDHVERGDLPGAIRACTDAVPLATLAYLGNRYQQALRLLETGASNAVEAGTAAGVKNLASVERLFNLARRVGRKGLEDVIAIIADGDLTIKQHDVDGLRLVIARITPTFTQRRI